jgi:hypothetical protein
MALRVESSDGWNVVESKQAKKNKRSGTPSTPVIITVRAAKDKEMYLHIHGLADTLLSRESVDLQLDGWVYESVIKGGDDKETVPVSTSDFEYKALPVENRWGDQVLYSRRIQK